MEKYEDLGKAYLSKNVTNCLKGIFAIMVLCHHLYQRSQILKGTPYGAPFQFMGAWAVAMFFFFSGYGLMASYKSKGQSYISEFPRKRILPFYIICIILIAIYSVQKYIIGYSITPKAIFDSFFFNKTVISNGWYLQSILLLYIVFYITFILPIKDNSKIFVMMIFTFLYIFMCRKLQLSLTKYEAVFCFNFGMLWCKWKEKIDLVLVPHRILALIISSAAFAMSMMVFFLSNNQSIKDIAKMISPIAFNAFGISAVAVIIGINGKIIDNAFTREFGKISLEVYVLQGFFINLFHCDYLYVHNAYLYVIFVALCTIAASELIHPLFKNIFLAFSSSKKIKA